MPGAEHGKPRYRPTASTRPPRPQRDSVRPFGAKVDPERPGQVGRRPPIPVVPILTGVMWIVVGVVIMTSFAANWKFVVGAVCIGVGGLFLRGGLVAIVRQSK